MKPDETVTGPRPSLTPIDAVAIIVGIVVGVGIFKTPAIVAANAGSEPGFLLAWLAGGLISLVGALCYAELATAYPHPGGEYHYLTRAFGKDIAWLLAWARLTVMQTGTIALIAFALGDYIAQLLPLGNFASPIYAACAIACLTALNVLGMQAGKWLQNGLTAAKLLGLACICLAGLAFTAAPTPVPSNESLQGGTYGLAMIFVLLTYGGWSEASYISAELCNAQRNTIAVLVGSIGLITGLFLLTNLAYLKGLGVIAIAQSDAVAADLMRQVIGDGGAKFISLLVAISALGAMNGTIFTGARTIYALGQDFALFSFLGRWQQRANAPANALLLQGAIALALVGFGTLMRSGFTSMVNYTAPVFWFFLLLTGISLFVLRAREPQIPRPFRVPLYPLTPFLFCAFCIYMLQASLTDTGIGGLVGAAVLLSGMPILFLARSVKAPEGKEK